MLHILHLLVLQQIKSKDSQNVAYFTSPARLATAAAAAQYSPRAPPWQQLRCEIPPQFVLFVFFHVFLIPFFPFCQYYLEDVPSCVKRTAKTKIFCGVRTKFNHHHDHDVIIIMGGCMFYKQRILHNNCESWSKL